VSDKVLRTRRIPNEDRLEAIIALLRAEVKAWREAEALHDLTHMMGDRHNDDVLRAMNATDAAGALEDK